MTVEQEEARETRQAPPQDSPHDSPRESSHSDLHTEVPKNLPKIGGTRLILMGAAVVVLFVILFLVGFIPRFIHEKHLQEEADAIAAEPPVVNVAAPTATQQSVDLPLPGNVSAMQQTSLFARVDGYLKGRYADIGDHVKTGQLLAEIEAPDVDAQLNESHGALDQAKANLISAQTNYDLTQATLARYKGLVATGGITQQDLDTRQTAFNQADAARQSADGAVKSAQATVERLEAQQGFEKIIAPFDGTVTVRNYDVGARISSSSTSPGNQMFDVSETDVLRVFVNVPQSYVSSVKVGQSVSLVVPNEPGRKFTGRVARLAGALDLSTRTMLTELHFDNHENLLAPGMYGEIEFQIHREKPVLTVPTTALLFESEGTQLATVKNGQVHFQPVTVGRDFGTEIEILVGLQGDEKVITNPGEKLVEGLAVQVANDNKGNGSGGPSK